MVTGLRTTRTSGRTATRLRGIAALVVGVAVLITLTALFSSGAATAASQNPDAEYYVSTVTGIEPAVPGLQVVVHGGGESITLTNHTGKPVVVLGYSGEDYLRIDDSGAKVNINSLTAALNADGGRSAPPTSTGSAKARPAKWRPVAETAAFTWQDFRTQWSADQRPPIVSADPHARHQVFAWAVQLTVDGAPTLVRGNVTWIGTPAVDRPLLVAAGAGAAALLALGLGIGWRRRVLRSRRARLTPVVRLAEPTTYFTRVR
jgi:hypothetical protein